MRSSSFPFLEKCRVPPTGRAPRAAVRSARGTRQSGARSPPGARVAARRARQWRSGVPPRAHFRQENAAAS